VGWEQRQRVERSTVRGLGDALRLVCDTAALRWPGLGTGPPYRSLAPGKRQTVALAQFDEVQKNAFAFFQADIEPR
jgi:hypothetical protein